MQRMKARLEKVEKAISLDQEEKPVGFYEVPEDVREKILKAIGAAQSFCDHNSINIDKLPEDEFLAIYRRFYDEQENRLH